MLLFLERRISYILFRDTMNKLLQQLKEVMDREVERNEMLKDAGLGDFALSDEAIAQEALKAADAKIASELGKAINGG